MSSCIPAANRRSAALCGAKFGNTVVAENAG
jgi:hypothetical protein